MSDAFRHLERERTIVFGAGALDAAGDLLGVGYTSSRPVRAAHTAPQIVDRAAGVVEVRPGRSTRSRLSCERT
jgi:hypothetical protein